MPARQPLYYTFGNHMHWVDMEWLWGYSVLHDSARDMLRFCQGTGAKGIAPTPSIPTSIPPQQHSPSTDSTTEITPMT